jgi:arylsulfatase A-like enzyme
LLVEVHGILKVLRAEALPGTASHRRLISSVCAKNGFSGYLGAGRDNWRTTPVGAIRQGDYKLLEFFEDSHLELYDLKHDLGEQHNLAAEKPGLAKQLHAKLVGWRQSVGAAMPKPCTGQEPASKPDRRGKRRQPATVG